MFKLVVLLALCAIAAAGHLSSPIVYAAAPIASGYEYTHTIQTPDYVNHASVSSPLASLVKTYSSPIITKTYAAPSYVPTYYNAPIVHGW